MKKFKRIFLVVVLLLVVAGVVVYFYLDSIIKSQVQTQGTNSLSLTTTLDSAHLSLLGGKITLNQLDIASPQGYAAAHMLELGKLDVAVSYGQLTKDPIHINSIVINKPHFVIEQSGGKMNFNSAMDTMPKSDSKPMKVVIDQLDVTDAVVDVKIGEMAGIKVPNLTVPIPSITLKNIGNGDGANNGAAMKDVVMQLVTALAAKASENDQLGKELQMALRANVGALAGKLSGDFQKQLSGITGNLGNLSKVIPGDLGKALPGDLGKKVGDLTNIGGGLGGLTGALEGKKDKDKDKK